MIIKKKTTHNTHTHERTHNTNANKNIITGYY